MRGAVDFLTTIDRSIRLSLGGVARAHNGVQAASAANGTFRLEGQDPPTRSRRGPADAVMLAYCPIVPSTRRAPFVFMPVVTAPSRFAPSRREARKSPSVRFRAAKIRFEEISLTGRHGP